ncbi:CMP-N-acetylneuraminate-beta-galactosamide-alpha-2,3-sialyltransferase 1 [Danio aesculapii]|uniref:CMP-N-acetylneuraminate-beta-galactosamide- alpha-2,3-sialyltransferase 1 n=1 Tax=Danio aesculapii TaxID=1142201 RepID=UPI0024C0D5F8|nr:CMP-N-acetylneuraminate-beta-galactosamide-alpha-2,3-sialyltransferase 1 [Danio aesculapii]
MAKLMSTGQLKRHVRYITAFLSSTTILLFLYFQNSAVITTYSYGIVSKRAACGCNTCVASRENGTWFSERYNRTKPFLLNSTNSELNEDILRWWKGLQGAADVINYTYVVDILFSLFPDEDHYSDAGPDRCRTCAVVGNSGNLLGSNYGRLIDLHDFVLRINKAPTKGFEKDVGSKTTHRIMYPESAVDLDNSTHLVLFPYKILDMQWLISIFTTKHITETYIPVPSTINADRDKVMILHPEFIKYVNDKWAEGHGGYPSTGFLTLIFALHICDEVNVFGFGATSKGQWHHYFDESMTSFSNIHSGDFENQTIHFLHQENKISLHQGWT